MDGWVLYGKFIFKALPGRFLEKAQIFCIYCRYKMSYHRSMSVLKYYMLAKHTADAESPIPPLQRQTTLVSLQRKCVDSRTSSKLSTARAKCVASACWLINNVDDEGLLKAICFTSSNCTCMLPLRAFTVTKKNNLYEDERLEEVLGQTSTAVLTGDYWT